MTTVELTMTGSAKSLEAAVSDATKSLRGMQESSGEQANAYQKNMSRIASGVTSLTAGLSQLGDSIGAITDLSRAGAERASRLAHAQNDVAQAALDVEQAQQDARQATQDYQQAMRDAAQATLDLRQAQRDVAQAALDVEQAQLDAEQATKDYNAAVKEHGKNSIEARQADIDRRQALEDLNQAKLDAQQADEDSKQAGEDARQAVLDQSQALTDQKQALQDNASASLDMRDAQRELAQTGGWAETAVTWVTALSGPLMTAVGLLQLFGNTQTIIAAATKVWTAAQVALNIVMSLNPLGLIIIAVVALIAVFVLLWNKCEGFRNFWKAAWEVIKDAALAVGRWFSDVLWKQYIVGAWNGITSTVSKVIDWFRGLPKTFAEIFLKVSNFITAPFRAAFNFVADAWNNTIGKLSWTVPGWVPFIGGSTISAPRLPHFHQGIDRVPGPPGSEMLAVLQAGERVIPASQNTPGGFGGDIHISVNLETLRDIPDFFEWVDNLRNNQRRGLVPA